MKKLPLAILDPVKSRIEKAVPLQLRPDRFSVDAGPQMPAVSIWNTGNATPDGG